MAVETTVSSLGGVNDSMTKMSRELTSMKADMIRADTRAKKAMEDVVKARVEVDELSKSGFS